MYFLNWGVKGLMPKLSIRTPGVSKPHFHIFFLISAIILHGFRSFRSVVFGIFWMKLLEIVLQAFPTLAVVGNTIYRPKSGNIEFAVLYRARSNHHLI